MLKRKRPDDEPGRFFQHTASLKRHLPVAGILFLHLNFVIRHSFDGFEFRTSNLERQALIHPVITFQHLLAVETRETLGAVLRQANHAISPKQTPEFSRVFGVTQE